MATEWSSFKLRLQQSLCVSCDWINSSSLAIPEFSWLNPKTRKNLQVPHSLCSDYPPLIKWNMPKINRPQTIFKDINTTINKANADIFVPHKCKCFIILHSSANLVNLHFQPLHFTSMIPLLSYTINYIPKVEQKK